MAKKQNLKSRSTTSNPPVAVGLPKYPPPKIGLVFVEKWNILIHAIVGRDNFRTGHLSQLEILCDLYQEYVSLSRWIEKKGHTYKSEGRNGTQYKVYPQVAELRKIQGEIRNYSKMLGLLLKKDESEGGGDEEDSWA